MGGNFTNFSQLVHNSAPVAFSVAFRMVGNEDKAKDIVQETMITLWKSIKKISSPESFMPWHYRIVVNKCYDQLRKRKRNPEFGADDRTWALISNKISENSYLEIENRETAKMINILTNKLSPKQKAVFVLSDLEEMSNEEVAKITGMSRTNVKANLHYARKHIGEMIEKYL